MRFMIIRKADASTEAGEMPSTELLEAMTRYNEELVNAGVMLAGEGLQPSAKGARVKFKDGKPTITDGPFAEAKELIGGWALAQTATREEAIEWTKRFLTIVGEGESNIRQVFGDEDLPPAFAS
jgi:hypothetical protein